MPNTSNIESPITLIAHGRSGTSLLLNIISQLPQIQVIGETTNLIFGCRDAVRRTLPVAAPTFGNSEKISETDVVREAIRSVFCTIFPSSSEYWFHKPIGVPRALQLDYKNNQWEIAAEVYWQTMVTAFPKAKYFTILRHPCDVVLSSKSYWGWPEVGIWRGLGWMTTILSSPHSKIEHIIHFDQVVSEPEETLKSLFEYLELDFSNQVLKAFEKVHVPSSDSTVMTGSSPSRKNKWDTLDPRAVKPEFFKPIQMFYKESGYDFELPAHIQAYLDEKKNEPTKKSSEINPEEKIKNLTKQVEELKKEIQRLHIDYGLKNR